jgi:hypothetical protein
LSLSSILIIKFSTFSYENVNRYGCPDIEEIESFNRLYKQKLDEIIERGEIPLDLAVEASYLTEFATQLMHLQLTLTEKVLVCFGHCRSHHRVQRGF